MDAKQFDLFERTIQFAADERRVARERGSRATRFNMNQWFEFKRTAAGNRVRAVKKLDLEPVWSGGYAVNNLPVCGTAACIAGSAIILHGSDRFLLSNEDATSTEMVFTKDGDVTRISERASQLFGFTGLDDEIFYMTDTRIEAIVERASEIAAKHGYELNII